MQRIGIARGRTSVNLHEPRDQSREGKGAAVAELPL
jgi:hypothetical protein